MNHSGACNLYVFTCLSCILYLHEVGLKLQNVCFVRKLIRIEEAAKIEKKLKIYKRKNYRDFKYNKSSSIFK